MTKYIKLHDMYGDAIFIAIDKIISISPETYLEGDYFYKRSSISLFGNMNFFVKESQFEILQLIEKQEEKSIPLKELQLAIINNKTKEELSLALSNLIEEALK